LITDQKLSQSDLVYRVYRSRATVLPADRHCSWAACLFT